jgi:phenylalanyl-tRNA synthetase alpha chain
MLPEQIAGSLNIPQETLLSLLESLHQKELVTYHVKIVPRLELTPEGESYAREGLPEVRLVLLLENKGGKGLLEELGEDLGFREEELRVALGWARRKGWITISKEEDKTWLKLIEKIDTNKDPLQATLREALDHGGLIADVTESIRQDLLRRTLVISRSKREITDIKITNAGIKAFEETEEQAEMIGDLSPDILKSGSWRGAIFRPYNLSGPVPRRYPGKKHPYVEFINRVYRALIGLGFKEEKGPLVELEFWNCDALFMPQDHVAREVHDMYHIKAPKGPGKIAYPLLLKQIAKTHEDGWTTGSSGWGYKYSEAIARRLVLRSQTTAVSVRHLAKGPKAPLRMFSIDRNFRPEKFDATHSAEFLQCEGIIGGEGLTLRDLMGYLKAIAESVGITKIKFKPGFFPFTEPSVEGFIYMPERGWVEALPGGIFRPEVTRPLGIDFPVLAWGIGLDRLAMAALKIDDIRDLATRSLNRLRHASLCF